MTYDPFKNARREDERVQGSFSLGVAQVVSVPDDASHQVAIQPTANTGDETRGDPFGASVIVAELGDVQVPSEGDLVIFGRLSDGQRVVLGTVYTEEDEPPSYTEGQRTIGHPETDANITITPDGDIILEPDEGAAATIGQDGPQVASGLSNPLSFPHTQWSETMNETEVWRVNLEPDEKLVVYRLDIGLKDGLTNDDLTIDIYDVDNDEVIASTTGVTRGSPVGESDYGSTVLARITNAADHQHVAAVSSRMTVTTN